jgi:hypothetical protein
MRFDGCAAGIADASTDTANFRARLDIPDRADAPYLSAGPGGSRQYRLSLLFSKICPPLTAALFQLVVQRTAQRLAGAREAGHDGSHRHVHHLSQQPIGGIEMGTTTSSKLSPVAGAVAGRNSLASPAMSRVWSAGELATTPSAPTALPQRPYDARTAAAVE